MFSYAKRARHAGGDFYLNGNHALRAREQDQLPIQCLFNHMHANFKITATM